MSVTGIRPLDRQVNVAMEWIHDTDDEFGWQDPLKTYHALVATLHALRDRLSVDEAADFAAQLPGLLRGVFYEGFRPSQMPVKGRDVDDFLDGIRAGFAPGQSINPELIATRVFAVLSRRVSGGEIRQVRGMLPHSFQYLWPVEVPVDHFGSDEPPHARI
ncbi:DUF2267 domain-containing protein [Bradymonas sediminis]|uniref:DUF2267 domain-containing protein n=1 Tax=Bradymonas sediminis TaxID=1548548 RepID=A0A2Z4FP74_9DELT|nr:DUF2267 domain-containing protein [Bradymonas sediminis]AWV90488.1 DUF2267 domain-containing protein [Bradymonas sediminis]TDP72122.1 uncharacterized protein (DUF2267 family) [Bradymonas sediminis]